MSLQVQRATRKLREEVVAHYSRSTQARDDVLAMMAAHTAAIVERSAVLEKKVAEHPRTDVN